MSWLRRIFPQRQNSNNAAVRRFFADLSKESVAKQITIGGVTGWCSGFLFRKVGKPAALAVAGGLVVLQVASHFGYIKINWPKVNRHLEKVEREISEYDPSYLKNSVLVFFEENVFVACSFAGGFLVGISMTSI